MQRLAEFVISALDLAEVQARDVGASGREAVYRVAIVLAFGLLVLFGALLVATAGLLALGLLVGLPWALAILGVLLGLAGYAGIRRFR